MKRTMPAGLSVVLVAGILGWPEPAAAEFFVPQSLGGSVSYGYGYSRSENTEMERTSLNLQLAGTGYFWEPWFVTMAAGMGVGLSETVTNPGGGGNSTGLSGNLDFTLFPVSRFPTQFGYSVTNSQTEMTGSTSTLSPTMETESRRFYLRQQYTSPGKFRLLAHYNRIESISETGGDSVTSSFGLDASKRQSYQTFHGGMSYSEITMEQPTRTGSDTNFFLNHSYLPGPDLGVISLIGYAMNEFDQGSTTTTENTSTQGSSSFYWRPEDRPFYVSGGLRVVKLETAAGTETRSAGSNISTSYNYSRNTRFMFGVSANATDSGDTQTTSVSENLSASYSSDPLRVFRMDYSWNGSLGFGNTDRSQEGAAPSGGSTAPQEDSVQSGSANLGHRLHKTWLLTKYNSLGFNFGQGGGVSRTSNMDDPTYSVSNGASLNWNRSAPGAQTHAAVQYSDNRSFGIITTVFKSWTFQLSRQQVINRLSGISGSFNYQQSSTETEDETDPLNTVSTYSESGAGSANLAYNHSRFLGIYRLYFRSSLTTRDLLRSSSEENTATTDEIKLDWRNNFTYNIGLLSMTLNVNMTDTGGEHRAWSAFFRVTRSF